MSLNRVSNARSRIVLLVILTIFGRGLFAQELFYSDDGMQRRSYYQVDTTLTLLNKNCHDKATYIFKRVFSHSPYVVYGSDTIMLPKTIFLDKTDSVEYFVLYNPSNKPIKLLRQDGSLITIKEAINYQNKWVPVEFWSYSWCGNSYFHMSVEPGQLMVFKTYKLKAGRTTYVRLRLKTESNGILISEVFECSVDSKHFILNTDLEKYVNASKEWFSYLK